MHDLLFENQDALAVTDLLEYATALRLDVETFASELQRHVHAPRVREDFMGGVRSGVNGTPTFYVNGRRHEGAPDLPSLSRSIEAALLAAEA
jgi:protein-disulfide isomerase